MSDQPIGGVTVEIKADTSDLEKGLAKAKVETKAFDTQANDAMKKVSDSAQDMGASAKTALGGVGVAAEGATSALGVLAATAAAVAVVMGVVGFAVVRHKEAMRLLENATLGAGRAANLTGRDLDEMATAAARAGGIGITQARAAVVSFTRAGLENRDVIQGLATASERYAAVTGTDVKGAVSDLTRIFSQHAGGVAALEEKIGDLTVAQIETIKAMERAGDSAGVEAEMFKALEKGAQGAATKVYSLGGMVQWFAGIVDGAFNRIGHMFDGPRPKTTAELQKEYDMHQGVDSPTARRDKALLDESKRLDVVRRFADAHRDLEKEQRAEYDLAIGLNRAYDQRKELLATISRLQANTTMDPELRRGAIAEANRRLSDLNRPRGGTGRDPVQEARDMVAALTLQTRAREAANAAESAGVVTARESNRLASDTATIMDTVASQRNNVAAALRRKNEAEDEAIRLAEVEKKVDEDRAKRNEDFGKALGDYVKRYRDVANEYVKHRVEVIEANAAFGRNMTANSEATIRTLEAQAQAMGMTALAADELTRYTQKYNAAVAANIALTPEFLASLHAQAHAEAIASQNVDGLTAAQRRNKQATEALADSYDYLRESAQGAFLDIIMGDAKAEDATRKLAKQLIRDFAQGSFFHNGPLGAMFGETKRAPRGTPDDPIYVAPGGPGALGGGAGGSGSGGDLQTQIISGVLTAFFPSLPHFHNGLQPDEFPAILQKGERVLSKSEVSLGTTAGGRDRGMNITIDLKGANGDRQIQAIVYQAVGAAMRAGRKALPAQQAKYELLGSTS